MTEPLKRRVVGIFGTDGTGKTVTARAIARGYERVLVYDPARSWTSLDETDAEAVRTCADVERRCETRGEVFDYLRDLQDGERFSLAYSPEIDESDDAQDEEAQRQEARGLGFLARVAVRVGDCVLVVDEAAEACGRFMSASMRRAVLARGRHHGVSVVACTQRPYDVRPSVRGACYAHEVYLFRLGRRDDLDDLAREKGGDLAARVRDLPDHHALYLTHGREPSPARLDFACDPPACVVGEPGSKA